MASGKIIRQVVPSQKESFCYLLEVEVPKEHKNFDQASPVLTFHLCSELLNEIPKEAASHFLHSMTYKHVRNGERIIKQGATEKDFYLILNGTCTLNKEKNNIFYNIDQFEAGDFFGEMVLFTDEPHNFHVDAETDADLLKMSREQFLQLSEETPDLKSFLSEVIMHRLSASKVSEERIIGKYSVTEKIGRGGSSIIYKGIHRMLTMPVVIKMLKHDLAMDRDFLELFRNEAKIIAQFNHPNIVKVYDIEEQYQTVFIIMEYLEGTPLKNVLQRMSKLPVSQVIDITMKVCFGLEYAHKNGIIHQDINPRNIFIQTDGQVKIIDFGLACQRGSIDENFLFPGTPFYIPPEQIRGDPVDERSDIYSLGITVYEMLTGKRPFKGCSMKKIINWHLNEDIEDTRATIHDIPDELHNFLMKTVRKDPSERYNNISEALRELSPLAERLGLAGQACFFKQDKVLGMFVVYQEEQQMTLKKLIEEFNNQVSRAGAVLKITQFEDR